jgi:opacity protein-like surface antigen
MKHLLAIAFILAINFSSSLLNAADSTPLLSRHVSTDDWLDDVPKENKSKKPKNYIPLFDSEFTEIREKHSKKASSDAKPSQAPKVNSIPLDHPAQQSLQATDRSLSIPSKPKANLSTQKASSTNKKQSKTASKNTKKAVSTAYNRDPKAMYDPKDFRDPKYIHEPDPIVIKEDIREGRIYVTAGIGGVLGTTGTGNIARVDNDAFQKASAAAYQGNSLTARFGRVDSDIAIVGMIGAGYDSSIRNRAVGYSVGLEYLYQGKALKQRYTTHDAFGNQVSQGELEVGETHYIMAKFLGKYRIDSWMPYIGIGGGMAIYNTQDNTSGNLHIPIFGNSTHAAPVIMPVAGLEYDLNQDWSLTGEYKYLYCPTVTFNKGLKGKFKSLDTHNLLIGAKYGF